MGTKKADMGNYIEFALNNWHEDDIVKAVIDYVYRLNHIRPILSETDRENYSRIRKMAIEDFVNNHSLTELLEVER